MTKLLTLVLAIMAFDDNTGVVAERASADTTTTVPSSWRHRVQSPRRRRRTTMTVPLVPSRQLATKRRDLQHGTFGEVICRQSIPGEETVGKEFGTKCDCTTATTNKRTTLLSCTDMDCGYCTEDGSLCERFTYGVLFDENGNDIEHREESKYIFGKSGKVVFSESTNSGSCSVSVNGQECASCDVVPCEDGEYSGVQVTCDNIPDGAVYNSCHDSFATEGVFALYNSDSTMDFCFSSLDSCQRDVANQQSDNGEQTTCECIPETDNTVDDDTVNMVCSSEHHCPYCNHETSQCGEKSMAYTYKSSALQSVTTTFQHTLGRDSKVTLRQDDCAGVNDDCQGECRVEIDGVECDSCTLFSCAGGGEMKPVIDCSNIDGAQATTKADLCQEGEVEPGSPLEFLNDDFTEHCSTQDDTECPKTTYEAGGYECTCQTEETGSLLACSNTCGDLCNEEDLICVRESFEKRFNFSGEQTYFRKDMLYSIGRKEKLSYHELEDQSCLLEVDGVECDSCRLQKCNDGTSPLVDCRNIEDNAQFDLCDANLRIEAGIFQRLSAKGFDECRDRTPLNQFCSAASPVDVSSIFHGSNRFVQDDGTVPCGQSVVQSEPSLWYSLHGAGSGVTVSHCHDGTDFEVHVSVYSGTCENLQCVASHPLVEGCVDSFFAEQDTPYYLNVQGTGPETGNFEIQLDNVDLSQSSCDALKTASEAEKVLCECSESSLSTPSVLSCTSSCTHCNEFGSKCVSQASAWETSHNGSVDKVTQTFKGVVGTDQTITLQKWGTCDEHGNCHSCEAEIDGQKCAQCVINPCRSVNQLGSQLVASCPLDGSTLTLDTCFDEDVGLTIEHASRVVGVLPEEDRSPIRLDQCFQTTSDETCHASKLQVERFTPNNRCECKQNKDDEGHRLSCQDADCISCTKDGAVCGTNSFGFQFNQKDGVVVSSFQGIHFLENDDASQPSQLHVYQNVSSSSTKCSGFVDSDDQKKCSSCRITSCPSIGSLDYDLDCGNIDPDLRFHTPCDTETSVFVALLDSTCLESLDPSTVCALAMDHSPMDPSSPYTDCSCTQQIGGGHFILNCRPAAHAQCEYCREDDEGGDGQSSCGQYLESTIVLDVFGKKKSQYVAFEFDDSNSTDRGIIDISIDTDGCHVLVNGASCACSLDNNCEDDAGNEVNDGGHQLLSDMARLSIDCSAAAGIAHALIHNCQNQHPVVAFLTSSSHQIPECSMIATSSPSTSSPTADPTNTTSPVVSTTNSTTTTGNVTANRTSTDTDALVSEAHGWSWLGSSVFLLLMTCISCTMWL